MARRSPCWTPSAWRRSSRASGAIALKEFRLSLAGRSTWLPLPVGAALSRARLDSALVEATRAAGAPFLPEPRALVEAIEAGTRRVPLVHHGRKVVAAARVVLAAGGLGHRCLEHEPVLRTRAATWSRVGAGCDVEAVPDLYRKATIFMAVGRGGDVGLVRVEDGRLNVAAAFDRDFLRHHGRPRRAASAVLATSGFPALAPLDDADWQGTVRLTRTTRPLAAERLFLLGDATGYVEPFTGEGMGWAPTSARAVAPLALRAIERWDPALPRAWSGLHRDLVGHRQRLCRGVATLLRHPRLARTTLDLVALAPAVARLIIGSVNAPALLSRAN